MILDRPALREAAREAQRCFLQQDWPCKELLIFNTTDRALNWLPRRHVRELRLARRPRAGMLEILRENATGEWCVLWDPDCWYAPGVIRQHMTARDMETAVLFRNVTCYALADRQAVVVSDDRAVHGSFFRLTPINFSLPFYRQTPRLVMLDNPPELVVKFVNKIQHDA